MDEDDTPATKKLKVSHDQEPNFQPLFASYNDKTRPMLDAHRLNFKEGIPIPLPTVVVIGDKSSGKSSVLESLAGISLPRVCTRVPLVIKLQHHPDHVPEFSLEFQKKTVMIIEESQIPEAINSATVEIAGNSKGISNVPITLVVKKNGVPDLTMIDLPGITWVPVGDQPENIYDQITEIIMEHITPEENIILNVLSAEVEFTTCESIRLSRRVDRTGQRTLAAVTKSDRYADDLLEKVTTNAVNISYVCVRNRIGNETFDEARIQEANLFKSHPSLSMIDKSRVGIHVLAQKLVQTHDVIISKCLPNIVNEIKEKLDEWMSRMSGSLKETLEKLLIHGEVVGLPDKHKSCDARLTKMVDEFKIELHAEGESFENFLVDEMRVWKESGGIRLSQFVPEYAFSYLLRQKVSKISDLPISFVKKVWSYVESVSFEVLKDHCASFPQLYSPMKKASQNALKKIKNKFLQRAMDMIEMEKNTNYTCDPNFLASWKELKSANYDRLSDAVVGRRSKWIAIKGYGDVKVDHLFEVPANIREQAFDLKMKMVAYWAVVLRRMVDWSALNLRYWIQKFVTEMGISVFTDMMLPGCGIEKMMEEPWSVAEKRDTFINRIHRT
ncbi:putative dynamin central domain, Dynamin superfamily [Helianthus annuus]|nr:putative dynamin stalk domain, Dynamin superfamily [Helianthus annuus]KAJ0608500.1 putative dynamin stalk domain, Dynamin superfamily [Helianthus annuus]KAJ0768564.1 putative dynamin stalk domain, Dynamin superfamily [Helianthus annuus]KAJ0936239.1 putative dynamin central domain, Dynamin superfamily [Helianthus annuus]